MHLLATALVNTSFANPLFAHVGVMSDTKVPLIMPALAFGAIAFGIFLLFGVITWTYRDVANRHANKFSSSYNDDNQHGSAGTHK